MALDVRNSSASSFLLRDAHELADFLDGFRNANSKERHVRLLRNAHDLALFIDGYRNSVSKSNVITVPCEDTGMSQSSGDSSIDLPDLEKDDLMEDDLRYLRASEVKKRPALDYMERIQRNINTSMRSTLVDWLVQVAEQYRFYPETLYLAVSYLDRYISGKVITGRKLQLVGVACLMIAAKYEQVGHDVPQVKDFCHVSCDTYSRNEVLKMESSVLKYLKFELTTLTAMCFLRRFVDLVSATQGQKEVPSSSTTLECLASYLTELSLLDYKMLRYAPSLVAASAVFLAQYILER